MARSVVIAVLTGLALLSTVSAENVLALQSDADDVLPGVAVQTLGRAPVGGPNGDDLVLARVTIEPSASIPARDESHANVVVLEEGRVSIEIKGGDANLTLAGGNGTVPLGPGPETILAPGDAISSGEGVSLALHNAGDTEAILLYATVTPTDDPIFTAASFQDALGTFSVETFACPEGMNLTTLEMDMCQPSAESLVQWSLSSDQFDAPLTSDEATIDGATATWTGLPAGTYFVDLTADSFAPGFSDYFIPSSNQVTRQDERTTRIYYDAAGAHESINAYVLTAGQSTP